MHGSTEEFRHGGAVQVLRHNAGAPSQHRPGEGSRPLKLAASAIIFVFLIPYTASLYNGLSRLFGMAFPPATIAAKTLEMIMPLLMALSLLMA